MSLWTTITPTAIDTMTVAFEVSAAKWKKRKLPLMMKIERLTKCLYSLYHENSSIKMQFFVIHSRLLNGWDDHGFWISSSLFDLYFFSFIALTVGLNWILNFHLNVLILSKRLFYNYVTLSGWLFKKKIITNNKVLHTACLEVQPVVTRKLAVLF